MNLQSKSWYEQEKELTIAYISKLNRTLKNRVFKQARLRQIVLINHNKEYLDILQYRIDNYDELSLKHKKE